MIRDAYRHWFIAYGKSWGVWFSYLAELARSFLNHVIGPFVLANLVGAVAAQDIDRARQLIIFWALLAISSGIIVFAGELIGLSSENKSYEKEGNRYYSKLINKDMSFYRDNHTGYLTASLRQHLDSTLFLSRLIRTTFIKKFVTLVVPVFVLITQSVLIGVVVLVLAILQIVYVFWASKRVNEYRIASHEIYRRISGEVTDDVTNIVAFKSSGEETNSQKRMKKLFTEETDTFWKRRSIVVRLDLPRVITISLLAPISFYFATDSTTDLVQNVELLTLTIFYVFQMLRNVNDLPDVISQHDDLITKLVPTLDTLSEANETIRDPSEPQKPIKTNGEIAMHSVGFAYGNTQVYDNFNLSIEGGEKVGIVGRSGAGKSTLASLLLRFDEVDVGRITLDGINIKDLKQSALRKQIAYVPQEPLLFHRTVKENIAYQIDASEQDIITAAKAAHAHEFIKDLPYGYDTLVGERGVKLSGGQKQRIVIARAVLKKAPIILFDEATSALDSESEEIIQQALPEIIGDHTAIIIAHRLSTVAGLDRIIVLHNGKIEEEGTHDQLLKAGKRYAKLWAKQTKGKSY